MKRGLIREPESVKFDDSTLGLGSLLKMYANSRVNNARYRYAFYALTIVLLPEIAMANLIIPMLAVQWPIMVIMLGGVIVVEVIVLRKIWPLISLKTIIKGTTIGNIISTVVGIPIANYLHYKLIYRVAVDIVTATGGDNFVRDWPYFIIAPIHMLVNAPALMFPQDLMEAYIKFLCLMPVAYVISYYIECFGFDINVVGEDKLLPGMRTANRYSYLFVFIATSILFLIMGFVGNSKVFAAWSYILNTTMWLAVWYPY